MLGRWWCIDCLHPSGTSRKLELVALLSWWLLELDTSHVCIVMHDGYCSMLKHRHADAMCCATQTTLEIVSIC
jgi:hypothetical protein